MIYDVSEVCDPCYYNIHVFVDDYCRSLYADIVNVQGGKIVWSFIKPLIMGKILYTPPNPAVNRIMEKVYVSISHRAALPILGFYSCFLSGRVFLQLIYQQTFYDVIRICRLFVISLKSF